MSYAVKEVDTDYYSRQKLKNAGRKPLCFKKKVDTSKVNLPIIKQWIEDTVHEQLPDDDIAVEFVYELLTGEKNPDIVAIQDQMSDFLGEKESLQFCEDLWKLLLSAQKDADGIPEQLIEKRKEKLRQQNAEQAKNMLEKMKPKEHREREDARREYRTERGEERARARANDPKTNYNRSNQERKERERKEYAKDHHDERERRGNTLL